ncbi:hypothetical protein RND71_030196 [Anisodus tanguticus]|uniref:UDP-N-acetylmuramate--L-alanine ligase n=1 Tax=Anisodus tanguticus TaxID=243964 RepID=A0AAE1RH25_9SOLA|nr:hypothetical protein RND71_030196 [Anisodus tanguticus]
MSVRVELLRPDKMFGGELYDIYRLRPILEGKSTTASMLAYVLNAMGDDLTAVIGAWVPQLEKRNIISGIGHNFVLEADEYDCCFLGVTPQIAVVTNIDWEHADMIQDEVGDSLLIVSIEFTKFGLFGLWKSSDFFSQEAVKTIFEKFIGQIRVGGHLILCGDSLGACSLINKMGSGSALSVLRDDFHKGLHIADISLRMPGVHNVLNSLAVIATISALSADLKTFLSSIASLQLHLQNFEGVSRRFERIGTVRGCHIYDDYAHHPTEIHVVLQAALQSLLAALKDDFSTAFTNEDRVVITEIYAARETNLWEISGSDLAISIVGAPSEFVTSLTQMLEMLVDQISKDPDHETVILTLGAGDITSVGRKLLIDLQQRLI